MTVVCGDVGEGGGSDVFLNGRRSHGTDFHRSSLLTPDHSSLVYFSSLGCEIPRIAHATLDDARGGGEKVQNNITSHHKSYRVSIFEDRMKGLR